MGFPKYQNRFWLYGLHYKNPLYVWLFLTTFIPSRQLNSKFSLSFEEVKVPSLLTLWGQGWSPSCSRSRSWSAGRPPRGPAPVILGPGWSQSDVRCTHAAGWSTSAAPPANSNMQTHAVWPIESAPLGQPMKRGIISCW